MKLAALLDGVGLKQPLPRTAADIDISSVSDDSRKIEPGALFVAIKGATVDSHMFLSDVVEKGARALVVEQDIPDYKDAVVVRVADSHAALARIANNFFGRPSEKMLVVGVVGTNGKTTTTYLIEAILNAAGVPAGVIGTIEYRCGEKRQKAVHTTPTALQIASLLSQMRTWGARAAVAEVSSHAIDQQRIAGIRFKAGVFTNLSQDHLDYHKTMESYGEVKKRFFTHYLSAWDDSVAVLNVDDRLGEEIAAAFRRRTCTYAAGRDADVKVVDYHFSPRETTVTLDTKSRRVHISSPLLGMFNVMNIAAAAATGFALELDAEVICRGIEAVKGVPGRFERIAAGQPFLVFIDYSHKPDALSRALDSARMLTRGRVIVVVGCGGDRDREKRPIMGRIAGERSDLTIISNDNPRSENPKEIARAIERGLLDCGPARAEYQVILDRRSAIEAAFNAAQPGDLVLIAGKGHEDYQIMGARIVPFDDREVAREILRAKGYLSASATPISSGQGAGGEHGGM
jgi:UDP-N-acetylmuramoyl-L-alanyl-D-glutamate--2,6-diaminopimelate ligase